MNTETTSGIGGWGLIILLFLFFIVFGNGDFFGGRNNAYGCQGVSTCEVEKQEIIDSARTQYLIEDKTAQTNALIQAESSLTRQTIDHYAYENLKDQLAMERSKNVVLENRVYSDAQFNALSNQIQSCCCANERRLDTIECQMLKRPNLFGVASTCSGQIIPPITTTA